MTVEDAYFRHWGSRLERVAALAASLSRVDPVRQVAQGLAAGVRLLRPRRRFQAVALVGAETSNAAVFLCRGQPVVAVAVEAWLDAGPNPDWAALAGRTWVPWADAPMWVVHELAHAVRYAEAEDALSGHLRATGSYVRAVDEVPLLHFLVDEGLAVAAAACSFRDAGPAPWLWTRPDHLEWLYAHERELWCEIAARLDRPPGPEAWARYFSAGFDGDLPPRAGYFMGWRLVERYLAGHPDLDLAAAARLPAETFLPPAS